MREHLCGSRLYLKLKSDMKVSGNHDEVLLVQA